MKFYLNRLVFAGGVHFGGHGGKSGLETTGLTAEADTLFSALCIEAERLGTEGGASGLAAAAQEGRFLLSGLMPYGARGLYVPRPVLAPSPTTRPGIANDSSLRKKLKQLKYLPVAALQEWCQAMASGDLPDMTVETFGRTVVQPKVAVSGHEDPQPWHLASFHFNPGAGLYFLVALADGQDPAPYSRLIRSLGFSGIGGKTTAGLGRFNPEECMIPLEEAGIPGAAELLALLSGKGSRGMALSTVLPGLEEMDCLEGAAYALVERRGFIRSAAPEGEARKKRPVTLLGSGSTFTKRARGTIADVSGGAGHPVYRYGMGLYLTLPEEGGTANA